MRCWLYHHHHVHPASATPGKCFSIKGVQEKHLKKAARAAKAYLPVEKVEQLRHEGMRPKDSHTILGEGMCRGPKWASKHWPKDVGKRNVEACFRVSNVATLMISW